LGADNGIGAAAMLAIIAEHQIIKHGPLELLFTTSEEVGFDGAKALDPSWIKSRKIINLDSEDEGEFFIGCAGGGRVNGSWDLGYVNQPKNHQEYRLEITKLVGGHSGMEIDLGYANAIKLMGRILQGLQCFGLKVSALNGGDQMNAIPSEAEALVFLPIDQVDQAMLIFNGLVTAMRREYGPLEPNLQITLEKMDSDDGGVILPNDQEKILQMIAALPNGVVRFDPNKPTLVETSNNIGILKTDIVAGRYQLLITAMYRSSIESQMDYLESVIGSVFQLADGKYEALNRYPAWEPNFGTQLLALAQSVYQNLYDTRAEVKTVHAGLECAVWSRMFPEAEIISFDPTMRKVHSPDEEVDIDSVGRFYDFLLELLQNTGRFVMPMT